MCILTAAASAASPAAAMSGADRQQLALDAIAGVPVSHLAQDHHVSRKFVYQQLDKAHDALDVAFAPQANAPADLLFWLPVTQSWIQQLVLALTLVCHSSIRGVQQLKGDLFDHSLWTGTIHNILHQAVGKARLINSREALQPIRIAALDEIFQAGRPVLVANLPTSPPPIAAC